MEALGPLSEALDTELKPWLDLDDPRHIAIVAKACIALCNHGGGRLILGIDNDSKNSLPDPPPDLQVTYSSDRLNVAVGKYALPKFEVKVAFKEHQGNVHPEITVAGGLSFPIITKSAFEKEVRQNAVYMRTIENGHPGTCEPRSPADWQTLLERCFDHREADIGRFFRRHLQNIVAALQETGQLNLPPPQASLPQVPHVPPATPLSAIASFEDVKKIVDSGSERFKRRYEEKKHIIVPRHDGKFHGFREVGARIHGTFTPPSLARCLDTLFVHQPHLTGWPTWVDSRAMREEVRPYVREQGWETLVHRNPDHWEEGALDFWRIEPQGTFYLLRTYEDDTALDLRRRGISPGQLLDFLLVITSTVEVIATIRAFALGLGVDRTQGRIDFWFRWTGLRGRTLTSWVELGRSLMSHVKAEDDVVSTGLRLSLDTPETLLWQSVQSVVQPLFDAFGTDLSSTVIRELTDRTLARTL